MSKKAIIVYGGWEGHQPKESAEFIAADLRSIDFQVELFDHLEILADEVTLHAADLIIPHWTCGTLTDEQESTLIRAITSGVGLGGLHGGMGDAFRNNTNYQFMTGGQFVSHPDNHKDYIVSIVKKDDPITVGLADFTVHSEQYYMHIDPANEVLATTIFETTSAPWINGTVMPVAWKRMHGQGRVFYHSIGHTCEELAIPEVRELTRRGLAWAAR